MTSSLIIPALAAFGICAALCPVLIPVLRRHRTGQPEREEGVKAHLKKEGTPTMGGLAIVGAVVITGLFYLKGNTETAVILIMTVAFALIGFLDDYLKVTKRRSQGLFPLQKASLQLLFAAAFAVYLYVSRGKASWLIPFSGGKSLDMGWISIPLTIFIVVGTVNGVNFTDGLDGLVSSVTLPVTFFFTAASVILKGEALPVSSAMTGALLAFLLFNSYPAKVFMGDTGALALGGFVAATAFELDMPLYLVTVGFIYLIEVLSVIIQVTYFKKTGGKRVFKMAPIHHHFELCGWSETRVTATFSVITAILCLISLLGL